jgi:arylsulfatase A-like enzyme
VAPHIVLYIAEQHSYFDGQLHDASSPLATPQLMQLASMGTLYTSAFTAVTDSERGFRAVQSGTIHPQTVDTPAVRSASDMAQRSRTLASELKGLGYRPLLLSADFFADTPALPQGGEVQAPGPWEPLEFPLTKDHGGKQQEIVPATRQLRELTASDHRPVLLLIHDANLRATATDGVTAEQIASLDDRIGRAHQWVSQSLAPEETLFIYTAARGGVAAETERELLDVDTRVPLIAVWPGFVSANSRSDALISTVDLLPTLVEVAGGTPPGDIDGLSFASVIRNESFEHRDLVATCMIEEAPLTTETTASACSVRDRRFKYIRRWVTVSEDRIAVGGEAGMFRGVFRRVIQRFPFNPLAPRQNLLTRETRAENSIVLREELYDLLNDPLEKRNLVGEPGYQTQLLEMRSQLSLLLTPAARAKFRLEF